MSYNLETVSAPGGVGLFSREGLLIEMRGEGAEKVAKKDKCLFSR